jgi:hypothetical protein
MIKKHEPSMKATHGIRTPAVVTESLRASDTTSAWPPKTLGPDECAAR